ncbi:MAG: KH domain-containing protein [Chthoniobacteraceae bacterium]
MEDFLRYVIGQLVEFPDELVITRHEEGRKVLFLLNLRQSDVGKVIGKHGQTIAAIRNLLNASAAKHGQKASVQIIEENAPSD